MLPKNEIQALFQLIDDPDYEVYDTVAHKIVHYGKEIIPSLEHLWETTHDSAVQERIMQLIHRVHFQDLQAAFIEWKNAERPELLRGAILVAQYQYPDLNVPFLLTQFDQMRRNLWLELNNYLTSIEKINVFNGILYNYYKLHGLELTDRKPDHFFVNKLLENKQGNVFSIGVLYLALAEILDIPIYAVNIPRQFLLAYFDHLEHFYKAEDPITRQISFFVDPINGMIYTHNDVSFYLNKLKANFSKSAVYKTQSTTQIIYKMLEELCLCYQYHKEDERAEEIQQLMYILSDSAT